MDMHIPTHLLTLGSPELLLAAQAALAGGTIIAEGWGKIQTVTEKGIGDLVSGVDVSSEDAIIRAIRSGSDNEITCEESGPDNNGRWIVDPLDATAGFIFQSSPEHPAVLIAHQTDLETDVAVVLLPLTGEWFYAIKGKGAFKGNGEKLAAKRSNDSILGWVDMNQYGDVMHESEAFRNLRYKLRGKDGARLVTSQVPHSAASIRMFDGSRILSAVVHDNNPAKVKQAIWDVAPLQLIIEESGGYVLNFRGERYNMRKPEPFIMAASGIIAQQLVRLAS